ncbi:SDR family NAD(P)-dependent oxidoreductase [Acidisoma cellulosilyticum]|uniref:SDR family NAD(P)-dependent oxidoreductase n=1 Tax=Acidisoma cellulosilyticum TaxID=2802395 RepID=UPI001D09C754|nr:SDR family NAD(P)-dependent oxidoreductase [Acidisoma cellulosilyticum]
MSEIAVPGRFDDQVGVVTGGAAGIGLAIAARIKREGGRVSLWDRDAARLEAAAAEIGADHVVALDIANPEAVAQAAQSTAAALGRIDMLVCSAGITGPNTPLADYPVDEWKRVIDVNLNGLFYCNKAVIPFMQAGGYGRIVNIASIAGKEGNPNASAYSASKAAVIGLTKSLGKELAKTEIRVNCVTPAAIRTAIFDQMLQTHIDFMLSKIPLGRFGEIEEAVSLICWLASREASFSTGAVFDVSGGRATY